MPLRTIPRSVWNLTFRRYVLARQPMQIFFGGASSGKSVFLAFRAVLDIARTRRNYLICRAVGKTMRSSVFAEVRKAIESLGLSEWYKINKTDMDITCTSTNSQLLFRGLDDAEKLKSVTPLNGPLTDIWIEEATETTEPALNQLSLRLRGGDDTHLTKRVTLSFNPINRRHWIRKRFFPESFESGVHETNEILIHHSTYLDNKFLTNQDRKNIEAFKDIDAYYYNVYCLGKWGVTGGVIFKNWTVEDLSDRMNEFEYVNYGLDFGYSSDPAAVVKAVRKDGHIYILAELYQKGMTNQTLAEKLKPFLCDDPVWCDSAEPKSIRELQVAGIAAYPVVKRMHHTSFGTRSSIVFGLQWLQQHKIVVHKTCKHIIDELSTYRWAVDKNGEAVSPPKPIDANNHAIDALRYAFDRDMIGSDLCMIIGDRESMEDDGTDTEGDYPIYEDSIGDAESLEPEAEPVQLW